MAANGLKINGFSWGFIHISNPKDFTKKWFYDEMVDDEVDDDDDDDDDEDELKKNELIIITISIILIIIYCIHNLKFVQ